jgi:cytochrome c-type biogenesis protein CcmH/NrfF
VLSILVWWAMPAAAVTVATLVAAVARRVRRARADVGTLKKYQRARQALARAQRAGYERSN